MAGHMLTSYFSSHSEYEVFYTARSHHDPQAIFLDVTDSTKVEEVIERIKPDITINCIGILNENASNHTKLAFQVNSLLPHQLAKLMERRQGKLIHISTDCVFLGEKGSYAETDEPDGDSIYAQSKHLGEIIDHKHLTIRTSIIGPELKEDGIGLYLWFMKQKGEVKGFTNVFWNGVTTLELAKAIDVMIKQDIKGLYHLGAEKPISKFQLLQLIKEIFEKKEVDIKPDGKMVLDRTIQSTRTDFYYEIPSFDEMLLEMKRWIEKN
ncbi:dTDP-4-dehydrorhamnose reductase [Cytobacillus purgationiresistens]|uniref:dTDP-4-dehydrorhamnose reductase n=2 Tax=Cytobacillus purgationiresistens TaxID=863449 RepID=A0ABU0AEP6_9BACI|nr:dTDP-4-dehydrorhamnose reductase [Cytobacillus purgationiresistens]